MNRLKTAKSTATSGSDCWGLDYTYDRYANLTNAAISSDRGGTGCSAPTLNLAVSTSTNKIANEGFQYDAAGNLTNDGFSTYTWNAEGRMASTAGVTYTYDGDGRRVQKSNGTLYWYGVGGQLLAESDANGNIISEYIFFGGMRIARRDSNGNVYYFLADRLGNARVLTNATGGVVEESDFYPFGVERVITDTINNQYKFTGHERDAESGLDHTHFRQYSCNKGRWLSPDSHRGSPANPQSWNRYAYGNNNPTNGFDPDGRQFWVCDYVSISESGSSAYFGGCTCYFCGDDLYRRLSGETYDSLTREERLGLDFPALYATSGKKRWDRVRNRIYAFVDDPIFTPEIMDCIAGDVPPGDRPKSGMISDEGKGNKDVEANNEHGADRRGVEADGGGPVGWGDSPRGGSFEAHDLCVEGEVRRTGGERSRGVAVTAG